MTGAMSTPQLTRLQMPPQMHLQTLLQMRPLMPRQARPTNWTLLITGVEGTQALMETCSASQ